MDLFLSDSSWLWVSTFGAETKTDLQKFLSIFQLIKTQTNTLNLPESGGMGYGE